MAKLIRRVVGAVLLITAVVVTQIPMPDVFAANGVEDFQRDEDKLVKYAGTATAVSVPDAVKTIGAEAFAENEDIGTVNVGKNTEEIEASAFAECKYLTSVTLPKNVITLDDFVFSGCDYLSKVTIGENLERIGEGVFAGCNSLSTLLIDEDNPYLTLNKGALYDAKEETLIAYLGGYGADTYNMPDTVKDIYKYSFWGNDTIEYVHLSSYLDSIPGYAFSNCRSLRNITLPYSVDSIEAKAFENCVSLTDVVIPASVTYIDPTAFDGCRKLNIIADKGTAGYEFFQNYLARLAVEEAEKEELLVPGTTEDETTQENVDELTVVDASRDPSNVGYMPSYDPLSTPEDASVKAKSLVVGGNAVLFLDSKQAVVYDGSSNFASNNNKYVNDSNEVVVGSNPQNTQSSGGANNNVIYDQTKGGYLPKYALLDNAVASQGFYNDRTLTDYKVPNGITRIGDFAYARSSMTSLSIPQGVTSIGYGAFYHCDGLNDVSIPSSVTEIEGYAFSNTPYLNNFLSDTSQGPFLIVGDGILLAYNGRYSEVQIPEGVKTIAPGAFSKHGEMYSVILPSTLTTIGEDAFSECVNLAKVTGGDNLKKIADRAFMGCPIGTFNVPATVKEIGLRAIDFTGTGKTQETKVVVFNSADLPAISVGKDSKRLGNTDYREDALNDVQIVVVPEECDHYDGTVLDSSLPGFAGLIVALETDSAGLKTGKVIIKESLVPSTEALSQLPDIFTVNGTQYTLPKEEYKLSANRHTVTKSKDVPVLFNGNTNVNVTAAFSSEQEVGTLIINTDESAKNRLENAYKELFGGSAPAMEAYDITLTDSTGYIPITKFGKEELTITMPVPEGIEGNRYRVICLDEDGQLEEVNSVMREGSISFTTTHLSNYAIYATGNETASLSLQNGKLVTNFKKDESPDTGDYSLPINYVISVGLAALGMICILCRKKKDI